MVSTLINHKAGVSRPARAQGAAAAHQHTTQTMVQQRQTLVVFVFTFAWRRFFFFAFFFFAFFFFALPWWPRRPITGELPSASFCWAACSGASGFLVRQIARDSILFKAPLARPKIEDNEVARASF